MTSHQVNFNISLKQFILLVGLSDGLFARRIDGSREFRAPMISFGWECSSKFKGPSGGGVSDCLVEVSDIFEIYPEYSTPA